MAKSHRIFASIATALGTTFVLPSPVHAAQVAGPDAAFTAAAPIAEARFGSALDAGDDRALVGSIGYGTPSLRTGAAYVFDRNGLAWSQSALLLASDAGAGDEFGQAVALDGDRALVGAHGWDALGATDAGAAYIFERQGDGTWLEVAQLIAAAPGQFAHLGWSVDLVGDRALVGAISDGAAGLFAGAALVFERQANGSWLEVAKLTDPDAQFGDSLGQSVALAGDDALVGAFLDDDAGNGAGSVHVFRRASDATWSRVQRLTASAPLVNGRFGQALSASGEWAAVGTWIEDNSGADPGRAHLFERNNAGLWLERQSVTGKAGSPYFGFGVALDIEGDHLVVGSRRANFGSVGPGLVRDYQRDTNGTWQHAADVSPDQHDTFDRFGAAVAVLSGDEFLGGAWSTPVGALSAAGTVHITQVRSLMRSVPTVSVGQPKAVGLALFGGAARAGQIYIVIGSVTGVAPGTLIDGVEIPLVFDAYTEYSLLEFNVAIITNNVGVLDAAGAATIGFHLPPGLPATLIGATVWHAAVVLDPVNYWPPSLVTMPVDLTLVP